MPERRESFTSRSAEVKSNFTVRKWAMNLLTTTLPLRVYLLTFVVFVTVIIYVQNGFSVGNYSLKCSHFSWNKSL